jgi:GH25 family lysozyme M1 (1,4-beta-N-acetylmuramidase)
MDMPGRLRRGAVIVAAGLGAVMLTAIQGAAATTAAGAGAALRPLVPLSPPVQHPNIRATHSPQVLKMLAGAATSGTVGQPAPGPEAATAGALQGVDVASFQEEIPISWPQAASAGIQFAAVKATEGDYYVNKYALGDLMNAKAAGISVLAYAYAIPDGGGGTASSSAVVQADDLVDYLKTGAAGVPPLMLDIEYNPNPDGTGQCYGLSQPAMVSWIAAFSSEVQKRTGQQPVIYTPPGWWSTCTGGSGAFGQLPLWTPFYSASATSPPSTAGWADWAFWQYASTGTVAGISDTGHTDLDQLNPAAVPLLNPGGRHNLTGSPVDMQIKLADPVAGQAPAYSGAGFPPGVTISGSGLVTGWPVTPGTFTATVTASGSLAQNSSMTFTWTVRTPGTVGPVGPVHLDLNGKCLTDAGNSAAAGTTAEIWTCNGSAAQAWRYVQDGTLRIHSKCLTIRAGAQNGWKVRLEPCTDGARQQWRLAYPRAVNPSLGGRTLMLRNRGTGKCLADPGWGKTNGTRVVIWSCTGYQNQVWTLPAGPAAAQIPGMCLDDNGNQTADGTKVDIWTCDGSAAQAWRVQAGGTVTVHGKCLDVSGSAVSAGTPVELRSCDGSLGQQWHLMPHGAGAALANPHSGLCLADPADARTDGTQLQVMACSAADPGQAWRVS